MPLKLPLFALNPTVSGLTRIKPIRDMDWSEATKTVMPNLKPTTKTISLRLPQHLLDSIKSAAHARDVPYQSLIKVWLQKKLHGH